MKLYKGYSPKNVNPNWIVTYNIPLGHPVSASYTVSISNGNEIMTTLNNFKLFPELYTRIPIGVSNETV